ncbi:MAG: glycosyltransferase family 2 protein [Candidatus Kariarchaeaceae archaeon]|jgi:hypothetical protein
MISKVFDYFTYILFWYFVLTTINFLVYSYPTFFRNIRGFSQRKLIIETEAELLRSCNNPNFVVQITTKGNEMDVICQGLKIFEKIYKKLPKSVSTRISVDLLTEEERDKNDLKRLQLSYNVDFYCVPQNYVTKNGTLRKARAMQWLIENRKFQSQDQANTYIIHMDAETVFTLPGLLAIFNAVSNANHRAVIFQGPIFYPRHWYKAGILSRQMESVRPWNCYECKAQTDTDHPYHLHGSNLVIRADIEEKIGWDFGVLHGYPLIAEDLLFGLKAYLNLGKDAFSWHGAALHEQPAFTLKDSIKQRVRWIRGTLQATAILSRWPEFQNLEPKHRKKMKFKLWYKVLIYAIGFIPALITFIYLSGFLVSLILVQLSEILYTSNITSREAGMDPVATPNIPFSVILFTIFGASLWLISNQIGLFHNLKDSSLTKAQKFREHVLILLVTPLAAIFDTGTAFFTTLFWLVGNKRTKWEVTPKAINY